MRAAGAANKRAEKISTHVGEGHRPWRPTWAAETRSGPSRLAPERGDGSSRGLYPRAARDGRGARSRIDGDADRHERGCRRPPAGGGAWHQPTRSRAQVIRRLCSFYGRIAEAACLAPAAAADLRRHLIATRPDQLAWPLWSPSLRSPPNRWASAGSSPPVLSLTLAFRVCRGVLWWRANPVPLSGVLADEAFHGS
jgi:hypothetical protein